MSMKIVPLEINEELDGGWGQYVILEYNEESTHKLNKSLSCLLEEYEEEKRYEKRYEKNCNEFCRIS